MAGIKDWGRDGKRLSGNGHRHWRPPPKLTWGGRGERSMKARWAEGCGLTKNKAEGATGGRRADPLTNAAHQSKTRWERCYVLLGVHRGGLGTSRGRDGGREGGRGTPDEGRRERGTFVGTKDPASGRGGRATCRVIF